jgi:hypothetical protein
VENVTGIKTLECHRGTSSSPKLSTPVFTIIGIAMAIVHHELYVFLDGKPVDANFGSHGQAIVPALGTFIAYVCRIALAVAISEAFVQVLWRRFRTRRQGHSIRHINALVSPKIPIHPIVRAWSSGTFPLAFIAALANLMAVITIWAPDALSITCFITAPAHISAPFQAPPRTSFH